MGGPKTWCCPMDVHGATVAQRGVLSKEGSVPLCDERDAHVEPSLMAS